MYTCEDIARFINDTHLRYECDTYQLGGVCKLSCDSNLYPLIGRDSVTCKWNSQSMKPEWDWENTTCNGMLCLKYLTQARIFDL